MRRTHKRKKKCVSRPEGLATTLKCFTIVPHRGSWLEGYLFLLKRKRIFITFLNAKRFKQVMAEAPWDETGNKCKEKLSQKKETYMREKK